MGNKKVSMEMPKKIKKRKVKINLVFDEAKRRDFLGGFHKRKLQRKKKAQEELMEKLKEEKKRIKQESKDYYKKLVISRRPIPELEELLSKEYESEDVTVKVLELSTKEIAEKSNWIGQNNPKEDDEEESSEDEPISEDELPGMELKDRTKKKPAKQKNEEEKLTKTFKSTKDIKKVIKKKATKNVQKSKAFQVKNKMDQIKNKKKSKRMKHQRIKMADKKAKVKHRGSNRNQSDR